ncbi:MAG TPA: phosphoglycolate phosphatase [Nitrososphaeraceae archaeon]
MVSIKYFAVDIDGTLTENGGGIIHLPALATLRYLENLGYKIIYVTGRSSEEAYIIASFGGTTKLSVGENGGVVMLAPHQHILLADKGICESGYELLHRNLEGVEIKPVFERRTEVVLLRTFDIKQGQELLDRYNLNLKLVDSLYAFHINEKGIDKGTGLMEALRILGGKPEETVAIGDSETDVPLFEKCKISVALGQAADNVKSVANYVVNGKQGRGLIEALNLITYRHLGLRLKNDV